MPINDTLPLEDMLQSDGWRMAKRALTEHTQRLQKRLETERYESLIDVKADQEMLHFVKRFLKSDEEVLQFLTPKG